MPRNAVNYFLIFACVLLVCTSDLLGKTLDGNDTATLRCCLTASSTDQCFEKLMQLDHPSILLEACAGIEGFMKAQALLTHGSKKQCPNGAELELSTSAATGAGWWGKGAPSPSTVKGPARYPSDLIAMGSKTCREKKTDSRWTQALARCEKQGYETVHVFVHSSESEAPGIGEALAAVYRQEGWLKEKNTKDRVFQIEFKGYENLESQFDNLIINCKIVDRALFMIHGMPGDIAYTAENWTNRMPINIFLRKIVSPCALAPDARLQFTSCNVACGRTALAMRSALEKIYSDPQYDSSVNPHALDGIKLLFNPDNGQVDTYYKSFGDWFWGRGRSVSVHAKSDLTLEYSMANGRMSIDVSEDKIPSCKEAQEDFSTIDILSQ